MEGAFSRWRRDGLVFRHRGRAIFYRLEGDGPTTGAERRSIGPAKVAEPSFAKTWVRPALVAIHGFPSASWDWHAIWPDLVARFRTIAPDMIGFGWSDKPRPYEYSIFDQASLHEGLLRELGITRAHVLAHDYGDTVAQELLARHEDRAARGDDGLRIESICFLNGGLFPEQHRPRFLQRVLASPLGSLLGRLSSKRTFGASMTAIFGKDTPPGDELIDELWTLLRHADGHRVLHLLIGYMAERREHRARWVGALVRTKVPMRVIDGAVDPVSGAHMVARYRELVPNPDAIELPAIGHYPQLEDPAGVLRAFVDFHDRLSRAR
jgi:pimeloyl-ACP methyl ester carboxylesterase